ncbi:oxidoreductase [Bacillus litorisediminis]|uniref:oxidoreductase n=1 Tax=Bacillus litorisediminis TaxID=2922713 RepID=UPI001FABFFDF|nr:oxidoreductase [Bacillus litorisediminis]
MKNKVAVVTGSSSGFGLLTSLEMAKRGFQVAATMRNLDKGETLLSRAREHGVAHRIQLFELDVTSEQSISACQRFLQETFDSVDVLVNNAGYAGAGFAEEISVAEYRKQFETNFFGVIAVSQSILPMMRKQRAGKIINVSSISGKIGFPGLSPYNASKYALEGFSESLRLELRPFGIDVVLVEPGSFQTSIWTTGKRISERSLDPDSPYYQMLKTIENHLEQSSPRYGDPAEVARLIADIAEKRNPALRYSIGKGVKLMLALKTILPWRIWENLVLRKIQ